MSGFKFDPKSRARGWPPFDLDCTPLEHWNWKFIDNPNRMITIVVGSVKLPSDTVRKGREFTLTAEVRDISNNPVDGAIVSFTFVGQEMVLTEIGGGEYQIIINTKEYDEGFYTIDVLAVREGYLDGVAQESITLEKPVGIPGFPSISTIVGLIIGITILRTRARLLY